MQLSEYMPRSELIVQENIRNKPKFPACDIHTHLRGILKNPGPGVKNAVESYKAAGIKKLVNLDGRYGVVFDEMMESTKEYKGFIYTFGGVDTTKIDEPDFDKYVYETITKEYEKGISGLKFFKNLSLGEKDKSGKYIAADDKRLGIIWKTAAELHIPVLIHIADPTAFFKPMDRFNERYEELSNQPSWSFCDEKFYKFDQLMEMQQNLIKNNPETTFIIAHVGSCSENLGFVSDSMRRFPNMYVDIAARVSELGRQPYSSKKFFTEFQDRILFGTDAASSPYVHDVYYRFLETEDEYFEYDHGAIPGQGRWRIYGISLNDEILQKVYYKNFEKLIK